MKEAEDAEQERLGLDRSFVFCLGGEGGGGRGRGSRRSGFRGVSRTEQIQGVVGVNSLLEFLHVTLFGTTVILANKNVGLGLAYPPK